MAEVGKALYTISRKKQEPIEAIELQREMGKSLAKDLEETVERHKGIDSVYFIKLILRKHRSLPTNHLHYQVVAPYFEKPIPEYDTTVFEMNNKTGDLKYLWSIPDQDTCENMLNYPEEVPVEEHDLFCFVKQFSEGTLK